MGIGTSLGAFFESDLDHQAGNDLSTKDNNEWSPNEIMPVEGEEPKIIEVANVTNTPGEILEGLEGTRVFPSGRGLRGGPTAQMRRGANENDLNKTVRNYPKLLTESEDEIVGNGDFPRYPLYSSNDNLI